MPLQIPILSTLHTLPSWCNLQGNIDRSACVEVRLAEVRRLAGCYQLIRPRKPSRDHRGSVWRKAGCTNPLPNEKPARNGHGRVATGVFTITARQVAALHDKRRPRTLAGDWRTTRAHVMRPRGFNPADGFKLRGKHNEPFLYPYDAGLDGNPNKGATRQKMIGLLADWSQPLRIEKWIFPKRIQPAYYLVCPGWRQRGRKALSHEGIKASFKTPSMPPCLHASMPLLPPPLSTAPPGRKATGCPQRCLKLLMVLCTEAEERDADLAQLWIDSIPQRLVPVHREQINTLIARYGPIMHPRTLLCPRCLGVAYGNNPETIRQGWRRRNNKPDTNVSTVITSRVKQRMEKVHPLLCTPQAGEIEKKLIAQARRRAANRKRHLIRIAQGKSRPKIPKQLPLIGDLPPDLVRAMAASENIRALITFGEHTKKQREKVAKKKLKG